MWWDSLEVFSQIMFVIACIGTGLLAIQVILLLIGVSDFGGIDFDLSSDGAGFFSIQGAVAFATMMGWSGYGLNSGGLVWYFALLAAVAIGFAAFGFTGLLYKLMSRLEQDGTMRMENGVGKIAEVYLRIPAENESVGKIMLNIQGRYIDANAVTVGKETFETGEYVRVIDFSDGKYIVEKVGDTDVEDAEKLARLLKKDAEKAAKQREKRILGFYKKIKK